MKFEGTEIKGTFEVREENWYFEVWQNGNMIYIERTDGDNYWGKHEYADNNMADYFIDSYGCWWKREFDDKGNVIYYENDEGVIIDERPKPKTKKVFRLWKYLEDGLMSSEDKALNILNGWPRECDGLTQEEGIALGRGFHPNWLVEENNNVNSK